MSPAAEDRSSLCGEGWDMTLEFVFAVVSGYLGRKEGTEVFKLEIGLWRAVV